MRRKSNSPAAEGFYMPAEFAPQSGCILIWPERPGSWPYGAKEARKTFSELILNLAMDEEVFVLVNPGLRRQAEAYLDQAINDWELNVTVEGHSDHRPGILSREDYSGTRPGDPDSKTEHAERLENQMRVKMMENIRVLSIENNDAWARDTGPTFVTNGKEVRGISWAFNAWGGEVDGLYANWEEDDLVAGTFCDKANYDWYDEAPFVLEGGSIHSDGEGTLLVTEACLLSGGRNPSMTKEQIEEKLKSTLGAKKVIWLPYGIYNDETNEHVDNVCAFTAPGEVVLAWTEDPEDPQYAMSMADLQVLEQETDAIGRSFKVRKMLIPKNPVCINEYEMAGLEAEEGEDEREIGERLAASYVNFYIGNKSVLVPQFGDVHDELALETLRECFPYRKIVPIQARSLIVGGGNIHCVTQQIPAEGHL